LKSVTELPRGRRKEGKRREKCINDLVSSIPPSNPTGQFKYAELV
jgi:hypothetical protein